MLLLLALLAPARISGLVSTELALTNKRILGRVGLFKRKYISLPHKAIEIVNAQRGVLGMLFNYGTLLIIGRDGSRTRFRGISMPLDMELQCNEAAEIAILGKSLSKITATEMNAGDKPIINRKGPKLESLPPAIEKPSQSQERKAAPKSHKDPNAW